MKEYIDVYSFEQLEEYILKGLENLRIMFNPIGMLDELSLNAAELICENKYIVSGWDTSNVTNMSWMFYCADSFDQPLNNWDVAKVTNMRRMFLHADSFNQPIGSWNVSNVTDMSWMFLGAESFNQSLNNWDVSNVTEWDYFREGSPLTGANTPVKFRNLK